jgi:hypothetical protein
MVFFIDGMSLTREVPEQNLEQGAEWWMQVMPF